MFNEKVFKFLSFFLIIVFVNYVFCDGNGIIFDLNFIVSIFLYLLFVEISFKIFFLLFVEISFKFFFLLFVIFLGGEKNFGNGKIDFGGFEVI